MREEIGVSTIWLPEKVGDTLKGVVKSIIKGQFGTQVALETDKGRVLSPSHKVLQTKLETGEVKEGDKLEIEYVGEEAPKVRGQSPTKMYKVFRL